MKDAGARTRTLPDSEAASLGTRRRLDSWKEIAEYLRRGVTTVQRWEREEGLPVHRHLHHAGGSVFAFADDLDTWRESRTLASSVRTEAVAPLDTSGETSRIVPVGGAVPLESKYYVRRSVDEEAEKAIHRRIGLVLVKGPRQVGKSSLLARALHTARTRGARAVFTDIQALGAADLSSPGSFFRALGRSLADQLDVEPPDGRRWDEAASPNANFSRYMQRIVLVPSEEHLVWGIDEVDRLAGSAFAIDVLGLFRSWFNRRALDPAGPWRRLTLLLSHATEPHLLMSDVNQSPFNVGVRLVVDDFTAEEVAGLSKRYEATMGSDRDAVRLISVVGGHPFLVQRALAAIAEGGSLETFAADALRGAGAIGDHLRRLVLLLERDPVLHHAMGLVLRGEPCRDRDAFYRLRSAGLLVGASPADAHPRCPLYARYLETELRER